MNLDDFVVIRVSRDVDLITACSWWLHIYLFCCRPRVQRCGLNNSMQLVAPHLLILLSSSCPDMWTYKQHAAGGPTFTYLGTVHYSHIQCGDTLQLSLYEQLGTDRVMGITRPNWSVRSYAIFNRCRGRCTVYGGR